MDDYPTPEEELEMLKDHAADLEEELTQVRCQIEALERDLRKPNVGRDISFRDVHGILAPK